MNRPYLSFLILLGFVALNAATLNGLFQRLPPPKPQPQQDTPS